MLDAKEASPARCDGAISHPSRQRTSPLRGRTRIVPVCFSRASRRHTFTELRAARVRSIAHGTRPGDVPAVYQKATLRKGGFEAHSGDERAKFGMIHDESACELVRVNSLEHEHMRSLLDLSFALCDTLIPPYCAACDRAQTCRARLGEGVASGGA